MPIKLQPINPILQSSIEEHPKTGKVNKNKSTGTPSPQKKLKTLRRALLWLLALSLLIGLGGVGGVLWYYGKDLPDFERLEEYAPPQMSRIFDRHGTPIGRFYKVRRTLVTQAEIAPVMIKALLSAEDSRFYKHKGLDYLGMLRAIYNSVRAGKLKGSGSTITQQTVKNILLSHEKTLARKVKEIILTRRIESSFSKDEILNMYLNTIYFGHGRYGIEEASRYFFGKSAQALLLHEAAMLAGVIQSPEHHTPHRHPESALHRRAYVLREMHQNDYITDEAYRAASFKPLSLAPRPSSYPKTAQWWVQGIGKQVVEVVGKTRLKEGGLRIDTTLDLKLQFAAQEAVEIGLRALDHRQKLDRPIRTLPSAKERTRWLKQRAEKLKGRPPPLNKRTLGVVTEVNTQGKVFVDFGIGRARIHPESLRRLKEPAAIGDVFPMVLSYDGPRHPELMRAHLHLPQAALIAMDPHTREILAMVGGWSFKESAFNRAIQARRQPGSAFKPFVYGAALESKRFTLMTQLLDAPETWSLGRGRRWTPQNYNGKYLGPILMKDALAKSVNSVAVRLTDSVGLKEVHEFARRVGLRETNLVDNLTLALGSSEVSPIELINAYATFVAQGQLRDPLWLHEVSERKSSATHTLEWPSTAVRSSLALTEDVAWLVCHMLRSVVTSGSGVRLKKFKGEVIGKTGTSNKAKDAWFIGSLPNLTFGVWVGYDTPRSLGPKESGGRTAASMILEFLKASQWKSEAWPPAPEGIETRSIDPDNGLLAHEETEKPVQEFFLRGTTPKTFSPRDAHREPSSDQLLFGFGEGDDEEDEEDDSTRE